MKELLRMADGTIMVRLSLKEFELLRSAVEQEELFAREEAEAQEAGSVSIEVNEAGEELIPMIPMIPVLAAAQYGRGEVKYIRTEKANWRFERVAGESGGRRWEVTGWRAGAEEQTVELGRWVTWKAAVEAMVDQEEQWQTKGLF